MAPYIVEKYRSNPCVYPFNFQHVADDVTLISITVLTISVTGLCGYDHDRKLSVLFMMFYFLSRHVRLPAEH